MWCSKGFLTLKSCNTLFQTELIYRARKPSQKTGNLPPWAGVVLELEDAGEREVEHYWGIGEGRAEEGKNGQLATHYSLWKAQSVLSVDL